MVEFISQAITPADFAHNHMQIDALIFVAAGSSGWRNFGAYQTREWEEGLNQGLLRAIQLIRAVGAQMVAQQRGCILILGGLAGSTGFPGWAISSAVEGVLPALTRSLACEWATSKLTRRSTLRAVQRETMGNSERDGLHARRSDGSPTRKRLPA